MGTVNTSISRCFCCFKGLHILFRLRGQGWQDIYIYIDIVPKKTQRSTPMSRQGSLLPISGPWSSSAIEHWQVEKSRRDYIIKTCSSCCCCCLDIRAVCYVGCFSLLHGGKSRFSFGSLILDIGNSPVGDYFSEAEQPKVILCNYPHYNFTLKVV